MSHPMDGCWEKVKRANENIHNLSDEIGTFVRDHLTSYRLVSEYNADLDELTVKAFGDDTDVPLRFRVLIGEIVHHLRSSLDHLIYELATVGRTLTAADEPWVSNLGFVIAKTEPKIKGRPQKFESYYSSQIKHVPASAVTKLKSLQPYCDGRGTAHPLAVLDLLSNTDKHRLLVVVGAAYATPSELTVFVPGKFTSSAVFPPRWVRPTKDGTELLRLRPVGGAKPGVQVRFPQGAAQIAFEKFGLPELQPVIPGIQQLRDFVAGVLRSFEGDF